MASTLGDYEPAVALLACLEPGANEELAVEHALGVFGYLQWQNELERAIDLVDAVRARFPQVTRRLPQLMCSRADACRDRYRFDEAIEDLATARRLARDASDAITGFYVEGVQMQVYLDLGLLAPAADSAREMETRHAQVLADERLGKNPAIVRGLALESARRRYLLKYDSLDHRGALRVVEAVLADPVLFPPRAEGEEALRTDEPEFLLRRGIAGCYAARDDRAIGKDVAGLLDDSRAAIDRALDVELVAGIEAGLFGFEEAQKGLLALADIAWQRGDSSGAERELDRLDQLLAATETTLGPGDEARRVMYRARPNVRRAQELGAGLADDDETLSELRADAERLAVAWAAVEDAWLRVPRAPEGLGFLQNNLHVEVLATWMQVVRAVHPDGGDREALRILARAQAVGTIAQRRGGGRALLAEAGARADAYLSELPERSGVVAFLPSLETSFVFAADSSGVVCEETEPRARVRLEVADLATMVEAPPPDDAARRDRRAVRIERSAGELADLLLPGAVARRVSGWSRVEFSGAELLGRPVLEHVPLDGVALAESHATSYLPGLAIGDVLAEHWRAAAGRDRVEALVLAGPRRGDGYSLSLAPAFVERLASLVGDDRLRTGERASLDALDDLGDLGERAFDVLVLLAHGAYDAALARPAMVALAEEQGDGGGMLTCAGLEALGPRLPRLVFFLTCGSAVGPYAPGDAGVADLGGAALLGGAGAALVSSSDVAQRAAEAALPVLLERLEAGDPPDEALRRARLAIAAVPGLDDPFHTRSLRLFGVGHLPLTRGSKKKVEPR